MATIGIREKYLSPAEFPSVNREKIIKKLASEPDKRIIQSDFDVFLEGRWLLYVKNVCRPATMVQPRFFLHVIPADEELLPPWRRTYGFDNLNFSHVLKPKSDGATCEILVRLPNYTIRHIHTGQYVWDDEGGFVHLWEGEFSMDQVAGVVKQRAGN